MKTTTTTLTLLLAATTLATIVPAAEAGPEPGNPHCHGPLDGYFGCFAYMGACFAYVERHFDDNEGQVECLLTDFLYKCGASFAADEQDETATVYCQTFSFTYPDDLPAVAQGPCTYRPPVYRCTGSTSQCDYDAMASNRPYWVYVDVWCNPSPVTTCNANLDTSRSIKDGWLEYGCWHGLATTSTNAAAPPQPLRCYGTDGRLACETTEEVPRCDASFWYLRGSLDVHAGCGLDPFYYDYCAVQFDETLRGRLTCNPW